LGLKGAKWVKDDGGKTQEEQLHGNKKKMEIEGSKLPCGEDEKQKGLYKSERAADSRSKLEQEGLIKNMPGVKIIRNQNNKSSRTSEGRKKYDAALQVNKLVG